MALSVPRGLQRIRRRGGGRRRRASRVSVGDNVALAGRHASLGVYPEEAVWRDPYGAEPAVAALGCVARYGWGAAARIGAAMGKSVLVMGLGAVGQFALRSFVAAGAYPVIGLDPFENRREAALLGGASAALDPTADTFEALAAKLLGRSARGCGRRRHRLPAADDESGVADEGRRNMHCGRFAARFGGRRQLLP